MNNAMQTRQVAMKRRNLKIHEPRQEPPVSVYWLINGFPARIIVWTAEEWAMLIDRPQDAQPLPNGIWCALRID